MAARRHALRAIGKSPLLQLWTSARFRLALEQAAESAGQSLSAYVRQATWARIEAELTPRAIQTIDRTVRSRTQETRK